MSDLDPEEKDSKKGGFDPNISFKVSSKAIKFGFWTISVGTSFLLSSLLSQVLKLAPWATERYLNDIATEWVVLAICDLVIPLSISMIPLGVLGLLYQPILLKYKHWVDKYRMKLLADKKDYAIEKKLTTHKDAREILKVIMHDIFRSSINP